MRKRRKLSRLERREELAGYAFASPWLIGFVVFMAFPILASLYMSFTSYNMITPPRWIGGANYRVLFTNDPAGADILRPKITNAVMGALVR